ncbi:MAG: conjugal transfer protein TraL [Neisseriaceae bacterium]|nr:conjugal transfer protein TraL [Neisseriaceae bacterium]
MKEVHFIAQGKGGVGKSFIASLIAQYLKQQGEAQVHCFDTDPVNPTFSRYKALNVEVVKILTANNNIDSRNFDGLIEKLIEQEGVGVIDNGAATFVPLMSYLAENGVPELLGDSGVRMVVHVPVQGGQALEDCLMGLVQTTQSLNAEVVVWLNDYNGAVVHDGKSFQDMKAYKVSASKIVGTINIVGRNPDTFGKDIQNMTSLNLTFDEVMDSTAFTLMPRQRLKTFKRDIFEQLDKQAVFAKGDANE